MKKFLTLSLAIVTTLTFLGFAASSASGAGIDTSQLQKLFQNASSADKAEVQKIISSVQAHDYPGAMTSLGKLASSPNLTSEQKNAVQNTANQIKANELGGAQKALSGGGELTNQTDHGAGKSMEDLKKSLNP